MIYIQIMIKLNLNEVKTQFSKYIDLVESGQTVVVCKRNIPVAEIRPIEKSKKKTPELGWAEGAFNLPADFNELPEEDLIKWQGDENDPLGKYSPKRSREK
jgi:prevent-host-death family protein